MCSTYNRCYLLKCWRLRADCGNLLTSLPAQSFLPHTVFSPACDGDSDTACTPAPQPAELHIVAWFAFVLFFNGNEGSESALAEIYLWKSELENLINENKHLFWVTACHSRSCSLMAQWCFFAIESCCAQGYKHTHAHAHSLIVRLYLLLAWLATWHLRVCERERDSVRSLCVHRGVEGAALGNTVSGGLPIESTSM